MMRQLISVCFLVFMMPHAYAIQLIPTQYLKTSAARQVTPFTLEGDIYLAVAQLSTDITGSKPEMNGGDSDVDVLIYKKQGRQYKIYQQLPGHGNEGVVFFKIDGKSYLAVASIRSGPKAPYNFHTYSKLYQWDGRKFYPIQQFLGFATKGVSAFSIGSRHFLGFANGVVPPGSEKAKVSHSVIYEWNGQSFLPFQTFDSLWPYEFYYFSFNHDHYLGLTDHLKESVLYRWNGTKFVLFQRFKAKSGLVFRYQKIEGHDYLVFGTLTSPSVIYRFEQKKFKPYQTLEGKGARYFVFFKEANKTYLLRINHILGTRTHPITALKSPLYLWRNGQFVPILTIDTFGGASASLFNDSGNRYVAVANALSKSIRFRVDSVIYQIDTNSKKEN
jgi:hypothetical protein